MDPAPNAGQPRATEHTLMQVLFALSFCHLLNDTIQSLIPALYPVLKESHGLTMTQVGLITLAFQGTASILQPIVGIANDHRPRPYSLAVGMGFSLVGLLLLSRAANFPMLMLASAMVGTGSSIFHPEASRLARLASGGRHGFAQSLFQLGGNLGSSFGPALTAGIFAVRGQAKVAWFSLAAFLALAILARVGAWYRSHLNAGVNQTTSRRASQPATRSRAQIVRAMLVLMALVFSKYIYLASLTNYYTFYLIDRFGFSIQRAEVHLFVFLFAVAAGTIIGGPLGDRYGRKLVIWISILGVAPFALALPYVGPSAAGVLTVCIGVILASAFSAILVYAQELVPGRVGLIAGLFFGFAFGVAGIGAALLGTLADHTSIAHVFRVCSFLPLIGLLAAFLPDLEIRRVGRAPKQPL